MSAAPPQLQLSNVYTAYDKADVLTDVSLSVDVGRITCILGSNGSGKSTLIRSILGLTRPRNGSVVFGGRDITHLPTHLINKIGVACIPEGRKVFPKLTVEENLRIGAYRERDGGVIAKRLEHVYAIFPRLRERIRQLGGTMSGGEQAMLSIGRGLMSAPKLLLIDEPSLGLSPLVVQGMFEAIRKISASGITIVLVEQNVVTAMRISTRACVLELGRIVAEGEPGELMKRPEIRQAYLGV